MGPGYIIPAPISVVPVQWIVSARLFFEVAHFPTLFFFVTPATLIFR